MSAATHDAVHGIGDYRFVDALGSGASGAVYLAEPPARLPVGDARVAVKVLNRRATAEEYERIAAELRIVAAIDSASLLPVYDVGLADGVLYYAMAYAPEGSLQREQGAARAQRAMADAARGAHALHEAGIVHRAIKPSNVLVVEGRGRLADIGLAHLQAPGMSSTGMGVTDAVEFIDPAALLGRRASRHTDVWSLGLTLHRVLTGGSTYGGLDDKDTLEALREVLHERPVISPELDPARRAVIERCVDPDLDRRFATARELAEAIEALPQR